MERAISHSEVNESEKCDDDTTRALKVILRLRSLKTKQNNGVNRVEANASEWRAHSRQEPELTHSLMPWPLPLFFHFFFLGDCMVLRLIESETKKGI